MSEDPFFELCDLAKVRFASAEVEKARARLEALKKAFEIVSRVALPVGLEPLIVPNEEPKTRPDQVVVWPEARDALQNAPELQGPLVKVPLVIQ